LVRFTCALTVLHYVVNLLGLELLRLCGAYEVCTHVLLCDAVRKPCVRASCMTPLFQARASPLTLRMLALSAVVGFAPGLNNVSLKYNGPAK